MYGPAAIAALRTVWVLLDEPAGKRLAPFLGEIVERLRDCGELDIDDATAAALASMSAATIDRRLAPDRLRSSGRRRPAGVLPAARAPASTWTAEHCSRPGFVDVELIGHTVVAIDVATGWTEHRAVPDRAPDTLLAAVAEIVEAFPVPVLDIAMRGGAGLPDERSPCDDIGGREVELRNEVYALLRLQTNFFVPRQKLVSKRCAGGKVVKRHDAARTPYQRILAEPTVDDRTKNRLGLLYRTLNPARIRRELLALREPLVRP